jgi:hypothetical protein
MMAEYIEREAFVESQHNIYCVNCDRRKDSKGKFVYFVGDAPCRACGIMDVLDAVEDFPAADVRPVVRARWEYNPGDNIPYCSECMMPQDSECNYCPNCGADMREKS